MLLQSRLIETRTLDASRTVSKEVREKAGATLYRSANTAGYEEAAAQAIAELLAYVDLDVKLGFA